MLLLTYNTTKIAQYQPYKKIRINSLKENSFITMCTFEQIEKGMRFIMNITKINISEKTVNNLNNQGKEIDKTERFELINNNNVTSFKNKLKAIIEEINYYEDVKAVPSLFLSNIPNAEEINKLQKQIEAKTREIKILRYNNKQLKVQELILEQQLVAQFTNNSINKEEFLSCLYYLYKNFNSQISKNKLVVKMKTTSKESLLKELEQLKNS